MMRTRHLKSALQLVVALCVSSAQAGAYEDFFAALANDSPEPVAALLQRGFDPDARDPQGQVALYAALRDGSLKVAAVLLSHPQIKVDAPNAAGETPLMIAALRGQADWVAKLLDRGARLELPGWGPLHYAATGPSTACVRLLLDRGAQIDARSPNGSTPLMMAARYGSEDSVDLLLQRGANPRLRNERDLDVAGFARLGGRDKLAERLAR